MDNPSVVHEQQRPWLLHGETDSRRSIGIENTRLAPANVSTPDQHQSDEIDTVAVSTLWSRPADSTGRIDAELVCLDEPSINGTNVREQRSDGGQQLRPHRRLHDFRCNWLKPALQAAMQGVVRRRLPMRTMRRQRQRASNVLDEAGMSTRPIAPTVT